MKNIKKIKIKIITPPPPKQIVVLVLSIAWQKEEGSFSILSFHRNRYTFCIIIRCFACSHVRLAANVLPTDCIIIPATNSAFKTLTHFEDLSKAWMALGRSHTRMSHNDAYQNSTLGRHKRSYNILKA